MAVNLPAKTPGESSIKMRSLDAMSAENDNLIEQVKAMGLTLEEKDERLRSLMGEVALLRRESERGKKNAKYDLVAREGQTKRLGILEHTVTTLRHDLRTNVERRQKVEEKLTVLERSWQNERSLRLQDLHRHDAMSSGIKHAERTASEAEGKWLAAEDKARKLQAELETRAREMQAQTRISEANESEIHTQATEIELHKTEILNLKKTLCTREAEISAECTRSSNLRRELSRVRRDYIVSTHNRSEQHNALLGGRKKNGTNPANSGVRRRASLMRDLSASSGSSACAPARIVSASTDKSSVPGGTKIAAPSTDRKCKQQQALSGLDSCTLQEARKMVSLDDAFFSKIKMADASSPNPLRVGDSASVLVGNNHEMSIERAHHAPRPVPPGYTNANVDDRPNQTLSLESKQEGNENKEGRARANPGNPGSTLLVPGSLYVGTGLGFKKTPVWVPPGGSAKDKLKNIMEVNNSSSNSSAYHALAIVHDSHNDNFTEERD